MHLILIAFLDDFKEILPVSVIKKYAKQNLNVENISYKRVVQEGLRL